MRTCERPVHPVALPMGEAYELLTCPCGEVTMVVQQDCTGRGEFVASFVGLSEVREIGRLLGGDE